MNSIIDRRGLGAVYPSGERHGERWNHVLDFNDEGAHRHGPGELADEQGLRNGRLGIPPHEPFQVKRLHAEIRGARLHRVAVADLEG